MKKLTLVHDNSLDSRLNLTSFCTKVPFLFLDPVRDPTLHLFVLSPVVFLICSRFHSQFCVCVCARVCTRLWEV